KAEIHSDTFTVLEVIGAGNFGTVHKGVIFYDNQSTVCAIKVQRSYFHAVTGTGKSGDEFSRESALMRLLTHPNVVRSFGMCTEDSANLYLLMEYCDMGDLRTHLLALEESMPLRIKQLLMTQVAAGLQYLHSLKIVHRDVAARNILLQTPTAHNT
ncbi:hypothetical protein SARC_12904, partial [Sphaeroforma arctica JP610]